jgi:2-deoxy-D-gluconate 3-dehydrogenase
MGLRVTLDAKQHKEVVMGNSPFEIGGKSAIVTGGAKGIGFGIVRRYVEAGANVLIADLDGELATQRVAELDGPGKSVSLGVDVSAPEAGQKLVDECVANFGSVDILVNNAGIYPMTPLLDQSRESWQRVLDINLTGLAFASKSVAQRMIEQGTGGAIVNIASIDALHPSMIGLAAYDSSKGGVLMFTRAFALEVAQHGITVNAIAPGGITTEGTAAPLQGSGMSEEEMDAMMEQFAASIPLGRMGVPDDIAKVALFLASPAAGYVTGELIVVDGGRLLK